MRAHSCEEASEDDGVTADTAERGAVLHRAMAAAQFVDDLGL